MRSVQGLLLAAVALVAGLVIGGLGPRQEARRLREALEAAPPAACDDRAEVSRQIAGVFRGRPIEDRLPEAGARPDPEEGRRDRVVVQPSAEEGGEGVEGAVVEPQDPEEAVRLAKQAMELRRAQARQALVEAGATEEQLSTVDAAMAKMNDQLVELTNEFVASVEEGVEPERREMMLFAADTLDVLITAEESLYSTFDEGVRAELDETALDPFSYVDGRVVEQLVQLRER